MKFLIRAYEALVWVGNLLKSPILLLCRLYWGWLFIQAGTEKLSNIDNFITLLQGLGFPAPHFQAYLVALIELIGGFCLMIGFASRLFALPLVVVMVTAYATAHSEALRDLFRNPSEFASQAPFNFLLTALIILAFGPGRFSLDYVLEKMIFHKEHLRPHPKDLDKI